MTFKFLLFTIFAIYILMIVVILIRRFKPRWSAPQVVEAAPRRPADEQEVLIEVRGVSKAFDHPVLKDLDLKIYRGETVGVLGRSGTGKSVLLKLLVGLLKPDKGTIIVDRMDITEMGETDLLQVRKELSYVFQGGGVFDFLDVAENIAYPLREQGWTDEGPLPDRTRQILVALLGWQPPPAASGDRGSGYRPHPNTAP